MKLVELGEILTESKVISEEPNPDKRITVKLNVQGVIKRPCKDDQSGATRYFRRKAGQFIYGKQNLFKGAFGIVPIELDNFESSSDIPTFDVSKNCLPEWIYYFLIQGNFYKSLECLAKGTGSKRIHPESLFKVKIPLPTIEEQTKIIAEIKVIENSHNNLSNEIEKQEKYINQLRQAVLQEAVQGKLIEQDPNDEPAQILLKKIKTEKEKLIKEGKIKKEKPLPSILESEIPYDLPQGWKWCRINDYSDIGTGTTPTSTNPEYYNGNINWVTSTLTSYDFIISTEKSITEKAINDFNLKIYPAKTLIIALYGQGKTRGQITELAIPSTINQACASIRNILNDEVLKSYTKLFFKKHYEEIRELAVGCAQPNLNLGKIKSTLIPFPPLEEQKRIVAKVDELMVLCGELEKQVKESKQTGAKFMQAVLQEAFNKD